ncbi:sorbosone dehydrogenase family protein [Hyphomicrobium sp.]|uniref:PQQ-dependent sugar dehydrogenase n=1 Tax=Hyphomicrobium sp. TaxID=82 RepID=UPI0025BF7EC4|nr:sorbosone dehydrogenase family protein [Hyphomicrobium sp.]MCC7252841.1 sorbosone dehydrogenase family protein [Hyphomicrobium sp.]
MFSMLVAVALSACGEEPALPEQATVGPEPKLAEPKSSLIPTVNIAPAVGWPEGGKPKAAQALAVTAFAGGLDHPRWLYVLPNGDVLVAETNKPEGSGGRGGIGGWVMGQMMKRAGAGVPSANRITLLRDANGDGIAETRSVFLLGLNSPFGMTLVGGDLYVANTDAIVRFRYTDGATEIREAGTKVVDLPALPYNHHWTKNIIASADGTKLFATVGSNSNVGENGIAAEERRAAILEIDLARGTSRVFASGLRNPNGMDWEPKTGVLWTVVNERDEIGHDLVPDYLTSVKDGGFYGWPYSYFGQHVDMRVTPQNPDLVASALVPDYALGAHTASLGLTFAKGTLLPERLREGAFIGQHGSWNRVPPSGYRVLFVPFKDGKPDGEPEPVLTGFLNDNGEALGRPVGVVMDSAGALLVADDVGNIVWRVTPDTQPASAEVQPPG